MIANGAVGVDDGGLRIIDRTALEDAAADH